MSRTPSTPVFYTFRRCPYCIRAHMALIYSSKNITIRSVLLKNLPNEVLKYSPDKTVPVLVLSDASNYHSWDIMKELLQDNDVDNWLGDNNEYLLQAEKLVATNESTFKYYLDRYKYADRFPEYSEQYYREQCELFLDQLTILLSDNKFLLADKLTIADIALFPFIRQFAMVDNNWFINSPYSLLRKWLDYHLESELFKESFKKIDIWDED